MLKKIIRVFTITVILILISSTNIKAAENPLSVPNNSFGIHILDENDLEDAAKLVNSGGGDWGYVTFVIRSDERDSKRWQKVFDKMRRLHLIPIVRIATKQMEDGWEKPSFDEIDGWVSFLSSLNWVVKNRYVVIGNEPNHAKEWGGEINPEEYADYLEVFSNKLKSQNQDFFILPAGFDASAPNAKDTMSETEFLTKMISHNPDVFNNVDGWASHSYPNPNFSGSQDDVGRGTVLTFEWELKLLEKMGVSKKLPIFITETGWAHDMESNSNGYKDTKSTTDNLKGAFELAWNDERVVAVTPFILNYQTPPFDIFSWKKKDGSFYEFYYEMQKLPKKQGKPVQVVSIDVLSIIFPPIFPSNGRLEGGIALIKNKGQTIWNGDEKIRSSKFNLDIELEPKTIFSDIEPGETSVAVFSTEFAK
ncbi:MAG: hypothetical protein UT24_C0001G0071 [Candidatus Woesebacteria bacterium GW2011_GWB1_39_12]|uniref:Glycoside hydrolase family 5 domain-containing protein n=2 Tax=Candidatus Woeseibacteriota TaxID=1752722 RepID=A0A0G0MEM6_9BACT|nr:MAG: hypothetical protein UT23_C0001G0071 [Candidatus Woesebacteria bacterium GW2011_GWA1_39_12]KKR01911.1 MAG: hypothetical protein UT24_C0001G0071 [Candidatus Woesebacteria bacterium GW2011_GWB1_39_12]